MLVCIFSCEKDFSEKIRHCQTTEIAPDMLQGMLLKYITAKLEGCQEKVCVRERESKRHACI